VECGSRVTEIVGACRSRWARDGGRKGERAGRGRGRCELTGARGLISGNGVESVQGSHERRNREAVRDEPRKRKESGGEVRGEASDGSDVQSIALPNWFAWIGDTFYLVAEFGWSRQLAEFSNCKDYHVSILRRAPTKVLLGNIPSIQNYKLF